MTEYEQMVLELYTINSCYNCINNCEKAINEYNSKINYLTNNSITNVDTIMYTATLNFEDNIFEVNDIDDIYTYVIYKGKKFGKELLKTVKDPKFDFAVEKYDLYDIFRVVGIIAIILAVLGFCASLFTDFFNGSWNILSPLNNYWWFDWAIIFALVCGVGLILFCLLGYGLYHLGKTFVVLFTYLGEISHKRKHCKEEERRKKICSSLYKYELEQLHNEFNNQVANKKQADLTNNSNVTLVQHNLKEIVNNVTEKLEKLEDANSYYIRNSIIPVTYLKDQSTVKKLLILLFNKRANNVTDLINLFETEEWRNKVISTLQNDFKLLLDSNRAICERLGTLDDNVGTLRSSIASVNESVQEANSNFKNMKVETKVDVTTHVYDSLF